jgi:thioredoxin reductase
MEEVELCIIGLGISGIAVAKHASLAGISYRVLEKESSPVGVWRYKSYETIELQTSQYEYCFEGEQMNQCSRDYPNRQDVITYFENIIKKYNINQNVSYDSPVLKCIRRVPGSKQFTRHLLHYQTPRGSKWLKCRYLAICSGFYTEPKWPRDVDFESFQGKLSHVRDFSVDQTQKKSFLKDQSVVVLGNGPSGCDIASYAKQQGAKTVSLLYRSPRWIFPRRMCGISTVFLINRFSVFLARRIPTWLLVIMLKILFKIAYLLMGIRDRIPLPWRPISRNNFALTNTFLESLKKDTQVSYLQIKKGTNSFARDKCFEYQDTQGNPQKIPCDTIICATGYQQGISFLSQTPQSLYRRIIPVEDHTIGFIGFSASFNWARVSDCQARWWIQVIQNKIMVPNINRQRADIKKKESVNQKWGLDYNDLSYDVYQYLDILKKDESRVVY